MVNDLDEGIVQQDDIEVAVQQAFERLKAASKVVQQRRKLLRRRQLSKSDPAMTEMLNCADEYIEARALKNMWKGKDKPRKIDERRLCHCEGTAHDRVCFSCGLHCCARCQPTKSGTPCYVCGGPVWGYAEEIPSAGHNPHMQGF